MSVRAIERYGARLSCARLLYLLLIIIEYYRLLLRIFDETCEYLLY